MNFADVMASSIHDMKNSLWMVINTLESLDDVPGTELGRDQLCLLRQEAKRLNTNLIELLTLYKMENGRVSADVRESYLSEFFEERVLENEASARALGIALDWECDPDLHGFFDEGLVMGVVNSLIGNGLRYARSRLMLSGGEEDGFLAIRVEDDGEGFPEAMLDSGDAAGQGIEWLQGRTHLGIYFARMVAGLHSNKGLKGRIHIGNGGSLGGGSFTILLP